MSTQGRFQLKRSRAVFAFAIGALVPLICTMMLHVLTIAGIAPLSEAANTWRLVTALIWPTFIPFSLTLGSSGLTWNVLPLLLIWTGVNAAIYALVAVALFQALASSRRHIAVLILVIALAVYWSWVIFTFAAR